VAGLAAAYGAFLRAEGDGDHVVVGRDSRTSGPMLVRAAVSGLLSVGCRVTELGIVPTPTLMLAVRDTGAAGGLGVTASHNPAEWNALKFAAKGGTFLPPGRMARFQTLVRDRDPARAAWDEIGVKAAAMDARSPTGAMSAIFEEHAERLDDFVNRMQAQPGQTGGLFALGDAICGLDVFDKPATFVALLPKLVRSYGIDALERPAGSCAAPGVDAARDFLAHLACGKLEEHPAMGLGYDVRIEAAGVIAGGLVAESSLIHLAAFAEQRASQAVSSDPGRFADRHQRQYALQCRR